MALFSSSLAYLFYFWLLRYLEVTSSPPTQLPSPCLRLFTRHPPSGRTRLLARTPGRSLSPSRRLFRGIHAHSVASSTNARAHPLQRQC
jgi:hypothetical protein